MTNLQGKTAVVTGSTSGIGLAYARAFAGAGANIVLNGMGAPADIEKERSAIEADFKDEVAKLETTIDPKAAALDEVQIRPKKTNITVRVLALAWVPWWKTGDGKMTCAWK